MREIVPEMPMSSFKEFIQVIIMLSVVIFMLPWMIKAKPRNKLQQYSIVCYDIFGNNSSIEGLRTEFKIHDVAWSFMKHYKKSYHLYNFALVSVLPNSEKQMIIKYI
jgi:hypothetical protein